MCTSCSGIHREFSHRVKSISLATFSEEEVEGVKAGGNEANNKLYMAKCVLSFMGLLAWLVGKSALLGALVFPLGPLGRSRPVECG